MESDHKNRVAREKWDIQKGGFLNGEEDMPELCASRTLF